MAWSSLDVVASQAIIRAPGNSLGKNPAKV